MKIFTLLTGLILTVSLATGNETDKAKDLSDFPNLPGKGNHGGHSRLPNPPHYDKKNRTLRVEELLRFQSEDPKVDNRKFIITLYQISKDGTKLTEHIVELYPWNSYCLFKKFVSMRTLKPFLFRSLPISEDAYDRKEIEHWQFRPDDTLKRIVKKTYKRHTDLCMGLALQEFAPNGHMTRESTFYIIQDDDPIQPLVQKEFEQYCKKNALLDPDWKNPVFIKDHQKDGTVLIYVHKNKLLTEETPLVGKEAFHYIFYPETKMIKFKQRI